MVNNVLWMALLIKVVFSNLIMKEMVTINYALILAMTFYTENFILQKHKYRIDKKTNNYK